jgi:addiction module HigA family antidote
MRNTNRRPVTVGQMLVTEFLKPMNIEINELADTMGVHRNTLSRILNDKSSLTALIFTCQYKNSRKFLQAGHLQ